MSYLPVVSNLISSLRIFSVTGESNVYTIGDIGSHRVVSTKIPQLGRQMAAQISAGNTTTRLLGKLLPLNIV